MEDIQNKAVIVVGLARSGVCAANLLAHLGASVTVTDEKIPQELKTYLDKLDRGVRTALGGHPGKIFEHADLIVVSPGVPLNIAPLKAALRRRIKIIGELELAYQIILSQPLAHGLTAPKILSVTGTNGKSTTVTLLFEMLKKSGFRAALGGNIMNALTDEVLKAMKGEYPLSESILTADFIVVEASSFQLETISEFRPEVATVLNVTPDHMDRYPSIFDYIEAKSRIFMNQGVGNALILNADDPATAALLDRGNRVWARNKRPEVLYFSRKKEVAGAYLKDGAVHFNLPGIAQSVSLNPETFRIKGVHNIENAMAASVMALRAGCPPDAVADTLESFPGLEHRLEFVCEIDGVKYINDSKGTNVGAVVKSLESFSEPIILIAGGRDKDSDFTKLRSLVRDRVKALVLIGEAREKIRKALSDIKETFIEDDFKAAIEKAKNTASPGDVVLLSPACASFDMFEDFEDRGRQFKKAAMEL